VTLPTLFIGVITHEKSQYSDSLSENGLAPSIAKELENAEFRNRMVVNEVRVNSENLFEGYAADLSERDSLKAELIAEKEWANYLVRPDRRDAWVTRQKRFARFATRSPKHWSSANVVRLLNIELSHRDLWQAGIESGSDWILIVEDDAYCSDPHDFVQGITALVNGPAHDHEVSFINLSTSFSSRTLGVKHLLKVSEDFKWEGPATRVIYSCVKPVTNTVCAILYSRNYLRTLVSVWDSLPMDPVLPIDWKMNRAIMYMHSDPATQLGQTLWVEPAPILQRSMHPVGK
jgi:GR25 family glycosyltransferase involved in LPS biosynthesis